MELGMRNIQNPKWGDMFSIFQFVNFSQLWYMFTIHIQEIQEIVMKKKWNQYIF